MHRGQVVLEPVSTAAGKQLQTLYGDAAWDVDDLDSDYDNAFRAGWRWYPVPAVLRYDDTRLRPEDFGS